MYLSFTNVTKRYGDVTAVDNVSFTVDRGEFVSLLGPSGCGKTTTLMLLAGFETPDTGAIVLDSVNLAGLPPEKRNVGVVFQHYALFPHLTVAENIAFGLKHGVMAHLSRATIAARVDELLNVVDLAPLAQRKPGELSAGQQQRVAIARSLAPRPRVVCFDEPLSALDALLREKLRLEIRRIQRELDLTVLYVTHDQEEALAISDRVVVMSQGKVAQVGTPWEVYDRPANHFAAGFIGKGSLLSGQVLAVANHFTIALRNGLTIQVPHSTWCGAEAPQPGDGIEVVLRAERTRVSSVTDTPNDTLLVFPGELIEVEFLGGSLRLHIAGANGDMSVSAPAVDFSKWQDHLGKRVFVTCLAEDVRLVPAQPVRG